MAHFLVISCKYGSEFVFFLQAIDFLDKLLRYDHQDRLTAKEAMVIFFSIFCSI